MGLKVFVIDDHSVALDGICELLLQAGAEVIGKSQNGTDAIAQLRRLTVDVVLIDVRIADEDGLSILEEIRRIHHDVPALILSAYENPTYLARAVVLGASDYLIKTVRVDAIREALKRAYLREPTPVQSLLSKVRAAMQREIDMGRLPVEMPLTGREAQVLKHVALGLSNKEIARSLTISVETVKEHVQNVLRKMSAKDRTDAAVRAIRAGLVEF